MTARSLGGLLRLLHDARHPAVHQSRYAEVLGVWHSAQHDQALGRRAPKLLREGNDATAQEVVAQVEDEGVAAQEAFADLHGLRDAQGRRLLDVGDLQAEVAAVAHGSHHLLPRIADHDANAADAGFGQALQGVEEDGLVGDGHQLLGSRVRERTQSGALTPAEDKTLQLAMAIGHGYPIAGSIPQAATSGHTRP